MGVIVTGEKDPISRSGPGITIIKDNRVRIQLGNPVIATWDIRIYGRMSGDYLSLDRRIEYSVDGTNYNNFTLSATSFDDPVYDLVVGYNDVTYDDIWIRPRNGDDVLLGDTISLDGFDPGDYPYSQASPYQYSVHNGVPISGDVDLYFQIAYFP